MPDVGRIAVLRANGIGDLMFTLPALFALQAAYPDAELTLLGAPWHASFLGGRPGPVHRVVPVPASKGVWLAPGSRQSGDELERFFARMGQERFDLALQLHGGGRHSNPFTLRLAARLTAGLRTPDAEPLDRWVSYVYYQPEVLRYLEVVSLVGAGPVTLEPQLAVTDEDLAEAEEVLGPRPDSPLVVLNPGAGDPRRRWPPSKLAQVGDLLAAAGADIVVSGGSEDVPLAAAVVEAMRAPALSLAGRLSLSGLAGLLSRSAVVVSNDSGPLHLAAAVGAATVGVYWCGNLINAGHPTVHRHRSAASWQLTCPVCGTDAVSSECGHRDSFVAGVGVEQVADAALELLSLPSPGAVQAGAKPS